MSLFGKAGRFAKGMADYIPGVDTVPNHQRPFRGLTHPNERKRMKMQFAAAVPQGQQPQGQHPQPQRPQFTPPISGNHPSPAQGMMGQRTPQMGAHGQRPQMQGQAPQQSPMQPQQAPIQPSHALSTHNSPALRQGRPIRQGMGQPPMQASQGMIGRQGRRLGQPQSQGLMLMSLTPLWPL